MFCYGELMDIFKNISQANEAILLSSQIWQMLIFIKHVKGSGMLSAQFDGLGNFEQGDESITLEVVPGARHDIWYFNVKELQDYTFIRFPLNPSPSEEICGQINGEQNPQANFWRWAQRARSGTIVDGGTDPSNLLVSFIVVGYKPKALLAEFGKLPSRK